MGSEREVWASGVQVGKAVALLRAQLESLRARGAMEASPGNLLDAAMARSPLCEVVARAAMMAAAGRQQAAGGDSGRRWIEGDLPALGCPGHPYIAFLTCDLLRPSFTSAASCPGKRVLGRRRLPLPADPAAWGRRGANRGDPSCYRQAGPPNTACQLSWSACGAVWEDLQGLRRRAQAGAQGAVGGVAGEAAAGGSAPAGGQAPAPVSPHLCTASGARGRRASPLRAWPAALAPSGACLPQARVGASSPATLEPSPSPL